MEKLLKQVLKTVKPSKKEVIALEKVSSCITKKLKGIAKKLNVNSEIVIGGSASRGTWMSGNHDLDFFMRFKSEDEIRKHYRKIVTNCFKGYKLRLVHGTRDYYKFDYDGFDVEIVPSVKYGSPEKAGNSADISYFHINYLKKKFDNNPKLRNEVLLLKQLQRMKIEMNGKKPIIKCLITMDKSGTLNLHYLSMKYLLKYYLL